ncbi:Uncharacterized protein YqkB [Evansella caseinilytica]|uniref:Uncharacterized protein YqkB n=1 Tax=Evansella caseinilytica TaxID=1503961 RepID=A0A1H3KPX1_9BACI|nr:iron-sulfur cluster biosynthesis family protein [Evansella caseinilytica]SDY53714.1 Uncharacterized protein YqkB [Evansella caseinilytica]
MKIAVTEAAYKALVKQSPTLVNHYLMIQYDIDGCGCVVSGVTKLVEKDMLLSTDILASTNINLQVAYEKQYDWVYDEEMMIDFLPSTNTFQLKSSNQIINPRMRFFPMTQKPEACCRVK